MSVETVLAPFEDPVVARWTSESEVRPGELLDSEGSLFLCGPSDEQHRIQGLFAALLSAVVAEAQVRVKQRGRPPRAGPPPGTGRGGQHRPNTGSGHLGCHSGLGMQLVRVCQDLSQLTARVGARSVPATSCPYRYV